MTKVDGKSLWTIDDNNLIPASFQYNREFTNEYQSLTKAQAQQDYNQSYNPTLTGNTTTDSTFYLLHTNPFRSWLVSMDGEFKLSDDLRLSVVPYFQYGFGGGGGGAVFTESTSTVNEYQYANQDLNGNGVIGGKNNKALAYSLNTTYTMRPGVIAKLNQDFGENNSLEYGVWWERPRQEQSEVFTPTDPLTGVPSDNWAQTDLIRYPNGVIQRAYDEYTTTETRKVFATDTWTPNDQWTITAGASYLWVNRTGFDYEYPGSVKGYDTEFGIAGVSATFHKVSPTAGVKYQLNEQNQFLPAGARRSAHRINGATLQNDALGNHRPATSTPATPTSLARTTCSTAMSSSVARSVSLPKIIPRPLRSAVAERSRSARPASYTSRRAAR